MAEVGWGIIGCGDIANKAVAPAVNEDPQSALVAFASSSQERAEDFTARHGARRAYSDIDAFLADPDIDVVYAASRVYEHLPQTVAAAAAGKHVLCEKPMALTGAECQAMVDACQGAGVNLAVAYYRRYYPKNIKIKELLDGGAIGAPVLVRMVLTGNYDPTPDDPKFWRVDPAKSAGGPIADVGSHRLDLLCHWFGEPASVAAKNETLVHSYAADDSDMLLIKMASGVQVTASFHWSIGVGHDTFEIYGTEGALFSTPTDGPHLTLKTAAGTEEFNLPHADNRHLPLVADFSARVLAGEPPLYTGEDGAKTTRIIERSFAASRAGKWIAIT